MGFLDTIIFILLIIILLLIVTNFLMRGRDLAIHPIPRFIPPRNMHDQYPHSYYDNEGEDTDDETNTEHGRLHRNGNGYGVYNGNGDTGEWWYNDNDGSTDMRKARLKLSVKEGFGHQDTSDEETDDEETDDED